MASGGQLPQPPCDWTSAVQFQPYPAGWLTRPLRLALNTSETASAVTATTEPASVARTGARCRPYPRSSACRIPVSAVTGRPLRRDGS